MTREVRTNADARARILRLLAVVLGGLLLGIGSFSIVSAVMQPRRTTEVYDPPVLAGQHLWGYCSGGFYARLGDTIVLTSTGHCTSEGTVAYDPDGTTVRGVFGPAARDASCPYPGHTCASSDINYLVVAEDRIPWGHLNVVGDYLIGLADPIFDALAEKQSKSVTKLLRLTNSDVYSNSRHLAVLDRHTGKLIWTATARSGFRHNSICAGNGKLFAIDRLSGRRSTPSEGDTATSTARVVAWDLATGKELWQDESGTFGTWLSYSEQYDVLVEAGRVARDSLTDEPVGMRAYRGSDGRELWYDKKYLGPAM
nr:PQQ-like beta-propeller repeat protein [Chloroflexota bacterium]